MKKERKRFEILAAWAKERGWTRGALIGVWKGTTLHYLLEHSTLTVIAVDIWDEYFNHGARRERTVSRLEAEANEQRTRAGAARFGDRAVIIKSRSVPAAAFVEDATLDFVFIDADHTEEAVLAEIAAWRPKIKPGGMLCGHDMHLPGVRRAIDAAAPGWQQETNHVWYVSV
jgi:hypothetical protein